MSTVTLLPKSALKPLPTTTQQASADACAYCAPKTSTSKPALTSADKLTLASADKSALHKPAVRVLHSEAFTQQNLTVHPVSIMEVWEQAMSGKINMEKTFNQNSKMLWASFPKTLSEFIGRIQKVPPSPNHVLPLVKMIDRLLLSAQAHLPKSLDKFAQAPEDKIGQLAIAAMNKLSRLHEAENIKDFSQLTSIFSKEEKNTHLSDATAGQALKNLVSLPKLYMKMMQTLPQGIYQKLGKDSQVKAVIDTQIKQQLDGSSNFIIKNKAGDPVGSFGLMKPQFLMGQEWGARLPKGHMYGSINLPPELLKHGSIAQAASANVIQLAKEGGHQHLWLHAPQDTSLLKHLQQNYVMKEVVAKDLKGIAPQDIAQTFLSYTNLLNQKMFHLKL